MCRLLVANGWKLQRIAGSHHIYAKPGERKVLAFPVHGSRGLKPGLANRIARDANLRW
ncbi:MAG: type II toxin-antitoxin system HicA family toxin [Bryobacteraceae bacterium]